MSVPSRKAMQRKPSHFGSYCHSLPVGNSSTDRASIGGSGGLIGDFIVGGRVGYYAGRSSLSNRGYFGFVNFLTSDPRVSWISSRFKLWRALSMQNGSGDRDIAQLLAISCASQQQPATAHISPSHEVVRESQLLAEVGEQNFDVFVAGHAAQENYLRFRRQLFGQSAHVALERFSISRVGKFHVHFGEFPQIIEADPGGGIHQSTGWRYHQHAGGTVLCSSKRCGVGDFSTEIEPTEEGEHFGNGCAALAAKLSRQSKLSAIAHNHAGAF